MHSVNLTEKTWIKSSYSAANGDCVEVAHIARGRVRVRDSKNVSMPALGFTDGEWQAFLKNIKSNLGDRA